MEIKNGGKKLLFNDFEGEENKKSSSELDFYVKYKDLGLDNEKQYYCYFYEKPDTDKDFVFNKDYVPEIRKNGSGAYDVKYSCNKNCVGLRFFVADKEIENNKAKDMSPEKNKDVTWYEVKQDEEGKKYIFKLGSTGTEWEKTNISFAYSDNHFSEKKRWKIGPYKKYGDHKFLTHFNNYSQVYIKCDKFKQLISNDINGFEIDANNTEFTPNVYAYVKLNPDGDFYLDWSGNMKEALADDFGTGNNHNGYMEDMYILRFYVTNKKLDINEGDKFDENELFGTDNKISVFEVRRDKSDNMVLWHLKNKEKNEWEAVDGEVIYYPMHYLMKDVFTEQITYHCTTQSENDISKSYTVNEVHEQHKTNTDKSADTIKQNKILDLDTKVTEKNLSKQSLFTDKNEIYITDNNIKYKFKKIKKSYTKARFGTGALGIFFVLSLILAWQISIYILIASAILLTMLIIYLIALKKNGFECTKIFCCCMDVEDEPQKENFKDNNLSNPRLNKTEIRFKQ